MAEKSIWIALSDDWELRGNGLGDVGTLQFDTALRLMDCYDSLGVTGTFNVEVMQQIAFERYQDRYEDISRQSALWRKAVGEMARRGYDVQLHTHPQWHGAEFDGRRWRLNRRWDITKYSPDEIDGFIRDGIAFLAQFVPREDLVSFRSGSWGLGPPSRALIEALIRNGIKLDVSIVAGLVYRGECIALDYTALECPYEPYYPDLDDARKLSAHPHGLVEIPTQSVPLAKVLGMQAPITRLREVVKPLVRGARYFATACRHRLSGRATDPFEAPLSPFGIWSRSDFVMDFSVRRPLHHWLKAIDLVVERFDHSATPAFLVFENHTKDLVKSSDFDRIFSILKHMQDRFGERIEFVHLKKMARHLDLLTPRLAKSP
ncbi:MAG: hypothetical protein IT365_23450 [Candidatus Hydrogenedentes bacterium]|nr:hypothetical protein [Candidatus Hydrogenedentota bacterium]